MKMSYDSSSNKYKVREDIFKLHQGRNKVIGLGGPSISNYVQFLKNKGFSDISIWENNPQIMMWQLPQIAKLKIKYTFGDILQAPIERNVLYDLDFCNSIISCKQHVKKFRNNFIMTIASRPLGLDNTIRLFLSYRNEMLNEIIPTSKHTGLIISKSNQFGYYKYDDGATMLIIYSINNY